ncbi:MAG: penicillin-binding protein 2 [Rubrobacteraceae bacterium]
MNAPVRRTFYLFALGFVAMVGVLAYWQVYAQESLANNPANNLQARQDVSTPRGMILAGDGETVLAESEPRETGSGTVYDRVYPQGPLFSNIVGYWSIQYDKTGIEAGENSNLSSNAGNPATVDELINQMTGGPEAGNNIELTLDPELQRVAYDSIAASNTGRGSAVALNPKTGEILALASYPSYDPNNIDERFEEIQNDPNQPLLNRATQGLYAPGSTFKVITAAAALEDGVEPTREFFDSGTYELPGYTVNNYRNRDYGEVTFTQSLVFSINAIFAKIGVEILGPQRLSDMAQAFGYGDSYEDFPLPVSPSDLGAPPSEWTSGTTAQVAFGQGPVLSNVFQMALVAAGVANGGEIMQPRVVKEVRSPDGVILDRSASSVRTRALPEGTAGELSSMMRQVVTEGNLTAAQIPGVEVAGKTGTAQNSSGDPHSWWISFAPADDPDIAVAVMIENGAELDAEGNADTPAIPVATNIIRAHLAGETASSVKKPGG